MNPNRLEPLLDAFVQACLDTFGAKRVEAVILHGSAYKGGAIPGYSDIDFQVYLTPDCFDAAGNLADDLAFAFQERFGPLPWNDTGYYYPQAYFYDCRCLPEWWTGPAPGSYRALRGELPPQAAPTAEKLRHASLRLLKELPKTIAADLRSHVDDTDQSVQRRLRLLGTQVTPAVFALVSHDAKDALSVWALSKFEALTLLKKRYAGQEGPGLAQRFFEEVTALYGAPAFDAARGRAAFRVGVRFLRWAERLGHELPGPTEPPTPGRSPV